MISQANPSLGPLPAPESNFYRMPNVWIDILPMISSMSEMKVVEYVIRHTWGFNNYEDAKHITLDEFINGKLTSSGERFDGGTGLAKQSVITGIKKAVEHGLLVKIQDDSNPRCIKNYYRLEAPDEPKQVSKNWTAGVQKLDSRCPKIGQHYKGNKNTLKTALKTGVCDDPGYEGFIKDNKEKKRPLLLAEKLYDALRKNNLLKREDLKPQQSTKIWSNDFRQFFLDREDAELPVTFDHLEDLIDWYIKHLDDRYIPRAYSASSFCNKYAEIYRSWKTWRLDHEEEEGPKIKTILLTAEESKQYQNGREI